MSIDTRPLAIFLMGPTASGKTALACALSEAFGLDLISVDSALVYRGLDIGTAKPDQATLQRYPHALVDIRDPGQAYSAGDFRTDALAAMQASTARGRIPLLVGGTGLYFRALQSGLSSLPAADPAIRARLTAEAAAEGWAVLHARLAGLDPAAAARIGPADAQRIQRALEVIEISGEPLSVLQSRGEDQRLGWRVLKLALWPQHRAILHQRIEQRFEAILQAGLIDEVRRLLQAAPLDPELPALRAVGYRQALEWLARPGQPLRELRDKGVFATRQLAKRQLTWLRAELDARHLPMAAADLEARATAAIRDFVRSN